MIFSFPVEWHVKSFKNDIMFLKLDVILFSRILPRLYYLLCGAIFIIMKRRIQKWHRKGAIVQRYSNNRETPYDAILNCLN